MYNIIYRLQNLADRLFKRGGKRKDQIPFVALFSIFKNILELNNKILELMAEMGNMLGGDYVFDRQYIYSSCRRMSDMIYKLICNLDMLAPNKYKELHTVFMNINSEIEEELAGRPVIPQAGYVMPYKMITGDFLDVVGGKNANIAELKNKLGLKTPEGFAITTRAYQSFLEYNNLMELFGDIFQKLSEGKIMVQEASKMLQDLIFSSAIPPDLKKAVTKALSDLKDILGHKDFFLAIRSSAWGEDSEYSFAGQYMSLLNEPQKNVLDDYKKVIASTYSETAMLYRQKTGFMEYEIAMAVACQVMVDAVKSGVLYTLDPIHPEQDTLLISSAWGLGAPIVSGKVTTDQYTLSRTAPYETVALNIVRKEKALFAKQKGGCEYRAVPEELQIKSSLTTKELAQIAETGLLIERYFKKPQDIEWAFDQAGKLVILQTRNLNIEANVDHTAKDLSSLSTKYNVIFANRGIIAQNGIGTGKVFIIRKDEDLEVFPQGAILVAKYTSPRLAKVVMKANGVITDIGTPTGHMATIAREFRIPAIVGTKIATKVLKPGQDITVDANDNVVYDGIVKELLYCEFAEEPFEKTYEYRLLRRVLKKISPLNLVDPLDSNFVPSACRTFHDITRFVHEKAVETLIDINYYHHSDPNVSGKKLKSDIPLDLIIIDIGGGFKERVIGDNVEIDQIASKPMRAFLSGLATSEVWDSGPVSVDFGSFMSSLTRTFASDIADPKFIGQNLAVISDAYANISLRLGYHFNMIDAYIGDNVNDNYIYFRFLGGVTNERRRSRRVRFIAAVLEKRDFRIELHGDLLVARIKKLIPRVMEQKVCVIGQLVAFTRQLDVKMVNDQQVKYFVEEFEKLVRKNKKAA